MTAQETNVSNGAESTLSGTLSSSGTTANVTDASPFPAAPFYAVIDPGNDSKREVVLVTAVGAGSFTVTRAQDGTSGVEHSEGAVVAQVPVAALWTDINDRVDGVAASASTNESDITALQTEKFDAAGHTKATHDALSIDADTVDGQHATDLLDRSNHTNTQAVSTLSDHNKATHDALSIDAATLGGMASGDFAAVAGDTFTGLVTFEDGFDGDLGVDVHSDTAPYTDWPTGLSWQSVTSGGWPASNGVVFTFNVGNTIRTFQLLMATGGPLYFRRRETSTTWGGWQTVTTAESPGLWEVEEATEVATASVSVSSLTDIASLTLTIPSDWGSWRCEAYATFSAQSSSSNNYNAAIRIDGTNQQTLSAIYVDMGRRRAGSVGGRRSGMTTTGSRTVSLRASEGGTAGVTFDDIYLYARAVRTS